ncbi:hypothetical protein USDA257_c60400 [Sinorhizobium fredii USDA 257]|uniref:Uncharacterized protein n=1 Tax=Sinorhizobium fredii (strain USDA 257) TaxID=1185652 RepID=I3XF87_SINF2|nr:hypothetical protein USDA257_c60400 [Sinorhizobium fredii USDA 257]
MAPDQLLSDRLLTSREKSWARSAIALAERRAYLFGRDSQKRESASRQDARRDCAMA